jgi:hypothetical protein
LGENLGHTRTVLRRQLFEGLGVANATDHIKELPAPGVSLHAVMRGNYNFFDVIPAVLEMCKPLPIAELLMATLSFSAKNTAELLALIDAGKIARVSMVCSKYFVAKNPAIYKGMSDGLAHRNRQIVAVRNHAKIILIKIGQHHLTTEGSANLRSARCTEQFVMSNDVGLYEFHRGWITQMIEEPPSGK